MSSSTTLGRPPWRPCSRADALALQGLLPAVLALGLGHAGEEREEGGAVPGGVVDPNRTWSGWGYGLSEGVKSRS